MKRFLGLLLFMIVVVFVGSAYADQGRQHDRHFEQYRPHYNNHFRPLDGIKIIVGIDRFGHKIEQYVLPPYPQKPKSRVGVDIQL